MQNLQHLSDTSAGKDLHESAGEDEADSLNCSTTYAPLTSALIVAATVKTATALVIVIESNTKHFRRFELTARQCQ